MNEDIRDLENLAVRLLAQRGLARAPGALAFAYKGQTVRVTIEASFYRGYVFTVHGGRGQARQFRASAGAYDWDAIAAHVIEIAERRIAPIARAPASALEDQNRRLADQLSAITGAGPNSRMSIQPSPSAPGLVRFRLDEVELDPISVIRICAAVSRGAQQSPRP